MNTCTICGTPLSGGCDTFGLPAAPVCQAHWYAVIEAGREAVDGQAAVAREVGLPIVDMDEVEAGTMMLAVGDEL